MGVGMLHPQGLDTFHHSLRLVFPCCTMDVFNERFPLLVCREVFGKVLIPRFETARVIFLDEPIGRIEYALGGAVIAREDDTLGLWIVGLELEDILDRGAAEFVDRLV